MAGDWIKVETGTPDKPEVLRMARKLDISRDEVLGKLFRVWVWLDANSVDGVVDGVVSTDVDAMVGHPGFASVMADVGWLEFDDDEEQIKVPNFDNHNGDTAKNRASKAKRQAKWRQKKDSGVDHGASTKASTREEKRREENIGDKSPISKTKKRKSRLPDGFDLTPERREKAIKFWNANQRDDLITRIEIIFEKFIAHHKAKGDLYLDWESVWKTWYVNALQYERPTHGATTASTTAADRRQQAREDWEREHCHGPTVQ